jgi:hypothetical protein
MGLEISTESINRHDPSPDSPSGVWYRPFTYSVPIIESDRTPDAPNEFLGTLQRIHDQVAMLRTDVLTAGERSHRSAYDPHRIAIDLARTELAFVQTLLDFKSHLPFLDGTASQRFVRAYHSLESSLGYLEFAFGRSDQQTEREILVRGREVKKKVDVVDTSWPILSTTVHQ